MTATVWPVNAINGAPAYQGRSLRQVFSVALAGAVGSRPLGARSGVRPGTPATTVTATSTTWTCAPFAGIIDGESAAEASAYWFAFDAAVSGSVNAADASNARIDRLVVQVSDPAEADGSSVPGIEIVYVPGTAAASPTVPALPARSFGVARISVPKSGGGDPSVTFEAPFAVAAGGVWPVSSATELAALPKTAGAYADLTATTNASSYPVGLYRCDGTTWTPVTGDTGWLTPTLVGGNTPNVQYRRINGVVYLTGTWVPTADSQIQFKLPAGFRPLSTLTFWCERGTTSGPAAKIEIQAGTGSVIYRASGGTGAVNYGGVRPFPADA